jgi:glycosyltransferase involved in cell wall biosynthesis
MAKRSMNATCPPALAYLVSQYPAVSHTFILREIRQLRQFGLEIRTASVKPPAASPKGFSEAEASEAAATFYVKTRRPWRIFRDHAACLARGPLAYLAGLRLAFRLAGLDLKAVLYHLLYFVEAVAVGEWMRHDRLDHLHVHFANAASTVALLVQKIYGIPYSMTVHGPDEFYDTGFYHVREKIEGASFICCISRFCRSQLMRASSAEHWEKMEVCPLGVDPDAFEPRHAIAEDVFHILCVGRLTPAKGQAILLAAVARLVERGRRVHADLAGDGPDRPALEKVAARLNVTRSVTFHGAVNQDRVRELLARADVFVLPSFAEGVPVSLMEAMAMEIPCISTTIAGIPELIESGEEGILVPPSDPDLLAAAVEKLIGDPELRLRLARAGRRRVVESYNLGLNVARLAAIFERRLAIRARPGEPAPTAGQL